MRQPKSHDPSGLPITSGGNGDSSPGNSSPGNGEEDLASAEGEWGSGSTIIAGVVIILIVVVGIGMFVMYRTRTATRRPTALQTMGEVA